MEEVKWVRGKALEVLIALRGLQVGDELKLKPIVSSSISFLKNCRCVGVVTMVDMECHAELIVLCTHPKTRETEWMYREQIVGWRRPKR